MKRTTPSALPTTSAREHAWLLAGLLLGAAAVTTAVVVETPWAGDIDIQGEVLADRVDVGTNTSTPVSGIGAGLGNTTSAGGVRSIVSGYYNAINNAADAAVFGQSNTLSSAATYSFAAGQSNTLHKMGCAAIGSYNQTHAEGSKAIGYGLSARSAHSLVVGKHNAEPASGYSSTAWTGTDADHAFAVGVGTGVASDPDDVEFRNALVVTQSGKILIPVTQGDIPLYNGN